MNRLSTAKRVQVIAALVEGNSINSIVRMTGAAKHTVLKLIEDIGCACTEYHHRNVRGLKVRRLQADEIWAFCGRRQRTYRWKRSDRDGATFGRGRQLTQIRSSAFPTLWAVAAQDGQWTSCRIAVSGMSDLRGSTWCLV